MGVSVNVAGMKWFSKEDKIALNIGELNFEKKKRGKKLSIVKGLIPQEFTRRDRVGKVAEIFDWDDKIPEDLKHTWRTNFEMKEIGNIKCVAQSFL